MALAHKGQVWWMKSMSAVILARPSSEPERFYSASNPKLIQSAFLARQEQYLDQESHYTRVPSSGGWVKFIVESCR